MKSLSLLEELQLKISQRNMRLQDKNPNAAITTTDTNVPKEMKNLPVQTISPRSQTSVSGIKKILTAAITMRMEGQGRDWHQANAANNIGCRGSYNENGTNNNWTNPIRIQNPQLSNCPILSSDFALPELELKPQHNRIPSRSREQKTNYSGVQTDVPRPGFVSQAVQIMEQKNQTTNNLGNSNVNRAGARQNRYEPSTANTNDCEQIQADDNQCTRLDKIRKTIQKFDHRLHPVQDFKRNPLFSGQNRSEDEAQSKAENTHGLTPSTYRVTVLNPEKPPKQNSKRNTKVQDNPDISEHVKVPTSCTCTGDNLHESRSQKLPEISKSDWRRKIVRCVSRVQPSVLINWDTVNAQIASRLRSDSQDNSTGDENDGNRP